MISKGQKKVRKINVLLFMVMLIMLGLGQYTTHRAINPSFFIYYYSVVVFIALISFVLTLYDIMVLRKKLLLMAEEHLNSK
ncbi:hypothetical protein [Candidatus Uabimicrobium sp. HlEnr_7]|uniref:hypothetical protein n=1 Tax=Candidatus Uabimicrobium helgolandensis TaxID=3095367 RepID=UPI003555D98B